jgi:GalNAc-alpha-(1->4)-GalNAc-alpha-(1->3)-diNAcBac-PP-undecaprenol alpha-1,4-N-acetyl-D-galactosaminyltransferase
MKNNTICLALPSLNLGGMERVMIEIAHYIVKNTDYEVVIVKLTRSDTEFYKVPEGVKVIQPDFLFNSKYRIFHSLKLLFFLIKTIRKIKPISVLSFGEMYNSFVLISSFFSNAKYFVGDRSQPDKKWGFFHEKMRKLIYRRADGIIAQTKYAKSFFEMELNHKNIQVIPNPNRDYQYVKTEKENVIIYMGRLIKSKRVDLLIEVFAKINNPNWKLWIVGDGPEKEKLEKQIVGLESKDLITIFGAQKNVTEFYSKAKIFAFTSLSEGFPNVLIEALSFALPCVAFDCVAGPSDIIEDNQNGFLIPLLDTAMFEEKLSSLMLNQELYKEMSDYALLSSKKYDVNVISELFLKFITS